MRLLEDTGNCKFEIVFSDKLPDFNVVLVKELIGWEMFLILSPGSNEYEFVIAPPNTHISNHLLDVIGILVFKTFDSKPGKNT